MCDIAVALCYQFSLGTSFTGLLHVMKSHYAPLLEQWLLEHVQVAGV